MQAVKKRYKLQVGILRRAGGVLTNLQTLANFWLGYDGLRVGTCGDM